MQKLKQGLVVSARRRRWRIEDVRPYGACSLVVLAGAEASNAGERQSLLSPFDAVDPIQPRPRPKRVRLTRWRAACRALLAADTPPGGLRTAAAAALDVFPHQLAPALAIVRGLGSRVLLADDVGLGKTMEAGLVVAELRARGAADRVLVLTPAGLRDQWQTEFASRFNLDATVLDALELRRRQAALPHGVNPWTTVPTAIASLDFAKRIEVLPAVAACRWDVVIVDEAHGIATDSDRRRAVERLAERAIYVLLLSATPHNGDARAFASLCRTGSTRDVDPILVFRRTRHDVALPAVRKVRRLMVRPTRSEARMHTLLARFIDTVAGERGEHVRLLASVLQKRACSSARSLLHSIARRLAALDAATTPDLTTAQLMLPLGHAGETTADDDVPAWHDEVRLDDEQQERRMLEMIAAAARKAEARETKIAAVNRLLRRVREPVIVFTEYRDTLQHLASQVRRPSAVLHGGLTRQERAAAVAAFLDGRVNLLLATDAAGEGLNLQRRCRVVLNLELPWNPMRLEQRIGRVDRIGQLRTVHAIHVIATGTVEADVLTRLRARVNRAHEDIAAPDPLGSIAMRIGAGHSRDAGATTVGGAHATHVDLHAEAGLEAARLNAARRRLPSRSDHQLNLLAASAPWMARTRCARTRTALAGHMLLLYQAACADRAGRVAESTVVGVMIRATGIANLSNPAIPARHPLVAAALNDALANWEADARRIHERFVSCRIMRERARAVHLESAADAGELQPGLFDRRAEAAWRRIIDERRGIGRDAEAQLAALAAAHDLQPVDPQLVLVLVP
jgi:superfamily II DNA or RNA helicase